MKFLGNIQIKFKLLIIFCVVSLGLVLLASLSLFSMKENLFDEKKLKTRHVVETAYGVLNHYYGLSQQGKMAEAEAKRMAVNLLRGLRYETSEYFWINDLKPTMIMHPMKPELDGKDLSGMKDPNGKALFMEFVKTVQRDQAGFVEYQWGKPNQKGEFPKISYVKGFEPWGWILGSGIYVDDVNALFWDKALKYGAFLLLILLGVGGLSMLIGRDIVQPIARGVNFAHRLSEGDLTQQLDIQQQDEIGLLARSLNAMSESLRQMFQEVALGIQRLTSSSTELSAISTQMSQGAGQTSARASRVAKATEEMSSSMATVAVSMEQTSTNLRVVATATEQMTETIHEISTSTERARSITCGAVVQSQSISSHVDELGKAADEIGHITSLITAISAQTNLLALNATIEAARAGSAGKSFAVVANEIKELARQTAGATDDIRSRIEGIQSSTTMTVREVKTITQTIHEVSEIVTTIATAIEEQAAVTGEIAGNIAQASTGVSDVNHTLAQSSLAAGSISREIAEVNKASGEISTSSDHIRSSAQELSRVAEDLQALVKRFKV